MKFRYESICLALSFTVGGGCVVDDGVALSQSAPSEIRTGVPVGPTELLAMVNLGNCTGMLISSSSVLTAAHCVCSNGTCQATKSVTFRDDPNRTGDQTVTVPGIVVAHPGYNRDEYSRFNDVAIINILGGSPSYIQPFQLATTYVSNGTSGVAAGYGTRGVDCQLPFGTLYRTSAEIEEHVGQASVPGAPPPTEFEHVFMDTQHYCPGDSGGALLVADGTSSPQVLYGVHSGWQEGVWGTYDVTSTVVYHRAWILSTIASNSGGYYPAPADYDSDGKTDIAVKFHNGSWKIDLAANGFGGWDRTYSGYGGQDAIPVPGDYDGDGLMDLSVKNDGGEWNLNFATDGLATGFNLYLPGYGTSSAIPVPADYDGDYKVDLAVKNSVGQWNVDYAAGGFGAYNALLSGYGGSDSVPVPGYYDGDLKVDLAVKNGSGGWNIDYASGGFGAFNAYYTGYGNAAAIPAPADYDGDKRYDLSVKDSSGTWFFDYASNGFGAWNSSRTGYGSTGNVLRASPATRLRPTTTNTLGSMPADYDGDGKADLAIVGTDNNWYIDYSSSPQDGWNVIRYVQF